MKRARLAICVACASILGAAFTGSAVAIDTSVYTFYDCDGPAGTPTTFTAVKTRLPSAAPNGVSAAAAFRLTDGSAIFVVLSYGEGNFSPPGFALSGNAVVTCTVDTAVGTFDFSGLLAPAP
jgi:hypothetical protein